MKLFFICSVFILLIGCSTIPVNFVNINPSDTNRSSINYYEFYRISGPNDFLKIYRFSNGEIAIVKPSASESNFSKTSTNSLDLASSVILNAINQQELKNTLIQIKNIDSMEFIQNTAHVIDYKLTTINKDHEIIIFRIQLRLSNGKDKNNSTNIIALYILGENYTINNEIINQLLKIL
jgi:hypothetical protein